MSLKAALEQLGYGPCHHLLEPTFQISRIKRSAEAVSTKEKRLRQERFQKLYQGYEVVLDLPGSACVDDLVQLYPDGKVIDPANLLPLPFLMYTNRSSSQSDGMLQYGWTQSKDSELTILSGGFNWCVSGFQESSRLQKCRTLG